MDAPKQTIGPLKSQDDRVVDEAGNMNSVSNQIVNIEDSIMKGHDYLETFKEDVHTAREEVDMLIKQLLKENEDVQETLKPGIVDAYMELKDKIKEQKDENEQLYKHLLSLKKIMQERVQKVELCNQRIAKLEDLLGIKIQSSEEVFPEGEGEEYGFSEHIE